MATGGRISLLIDSPLRNLAFAMRELDAEVKRQIGKATKSAALPIWRESTLAQVTGRLTAHLADSAQVSVTAQNIFLGVGVYSTLSSGTPIAVVAKAVEFGADSSTPVRTRSAKGKPYTRRMGGAFGPPRRGGKVAYPAASESAIRRVASLWVQTAIRTIHEQIEKVPSG